MERAGDVDFASDEEEDLAQLTREGNMRVTTRAVAVAAALALGAPQAAVAFDPQPDPPGFERLLGEVRALPAVQSPTPFYAKAFAAASALERGQDCTAVNILGALGNQARALNFTNVAAAAGDLAANVGCVAER